MGILAIMAVGLTLAAALLALRAKTNNQAMSSPDCDPALCAPSQCKVGFHAELLHGGCCPSCVPDGEQFAEIDPCARAHCAACPQGTRPEAVPGQCCPRCVDSDREACEQGRARYEARRVELETKLRGCVADQDCTVASFGDACQASCPLALNKHSLGSVVANLREEASVHCEKCAPAPFECQHLDVKTARCVSGRCELAAPISVAVPH